MPHCGAGTFRAQGVQRRPEWRVALALLLVAAGTPPTALTPALGPTFLQQYLRDPDAHLQAALAAGREDVDGLPSPVVLLLADAQLRARRSRAAARLFREVAARAEEGPWREWAGFGLGWLALVHGDVRAGREHYQALANEGGGNAAATLLLGLLEAMDRNPKALPLLRALHADPTLQPSVRDVAGLGMGCALLWTGDFHAAADAFDHQAAAGGPLRDDARYGAAWARWRAGDQAEAMMRLRALAAARGESGSNPGPVTGALVALRPRAVLGASLSRYRDLRPGPPQELLVPLLDADGAGLALAALYQLGVQAVDVPGDAPTAPEGQPGQEPASVRGDDALRPRMPREAGSRAPVPAPEPARSRDSAVRWILAALAAVVLLATALKRAWDRARPPRPR